MVGEVPGSVSRLREIHTLERRDAESVAAAAHASREAGGLPTGAAEEVRHTRQVFAHTHAGEDWQFLVLLEVRVPHRTTGERGSREGVAESCRAGAEYSRSSRMASFVAPFRSLMRYLSSERHHKDKERHHAITSSCHGSHQRPAKGGTAGQHQLAVLQTRLRRETHWRQGHGDTSKTVQG